MIETDIYGNEGRDERLSKLEAKLANESVDRKFSCLELQGKVSLIDSKLQTFASIEANVTARFKIIDSAFLEFS